MKLTEKETAEVEKLLSSFEKRARASRRFRWASLAVPLFLLGSGVYILSMMWHRVPGLQSTYEGLLPEGQIKGSDVENYVKIQGTLLYSYILLYGAGLLQIVVGILLLIKTAANWNKGTRDLLIAKILRSKWDDEKVNYDATIQRDN